MKKFFTVLTVVLLTTKVFAQSPEKMSYQAVIRNASNNLITSSAVGMQISILQGSADGTAVYIERHFPTTNANGLVSIEVGAGTVIIGSFTLIDWTNGLYFIKTETDLNSGVNYTITGTSQLLSVPFALHARTAETVTGGITENDPVYNAWDKDYNDLTNKPTLFSGSFTDLTDMPTTISGYGITDAFDGNYNNLTNKPSAISDFAMNANSQNITNLANPVNNQDAVTKAYVDQLKSQIEDLQVLTGIKIKDIDGNIYNIVTIGTQVWMAENLKTTKYNNGTDIPLITDNTVWSDLTTPGYCWYDNDSASYAQAYGSMYNWYTVNTGNLCPTGWHVPTDDEWTELTDYISANGHSGTEGTALKSTSGWNSDGNGTDAYNFTALPGGLRNDSNGAFLYGDGGYTGAWWSATEDFSSIAWWRTLRSDNTIVQRPNGNESYGFSVRCVRDSE